MANEKKSFRDLRHVDKSFYLASDERFYEPNYEHYRPKEELRSLVLSVIDASGSTWRIHSKDVWTHVGPIANRDGAPSLPKQGWKIHVSATTVNCREILEKVARLAIENGIQFKFANDVETLRLMTSKRWPRGGSGKFITIYPSAEEEFRAFLDVAYDNLKDYAGSYILSDRRYRDCRCLYYRYGGIISAIRADYTGRKQEILKSPSGEEVPDKRNPYFELPHWVSDIFPEEPMVGGDMTLNYGRFTIKNALAFSNTGGVYLATDAVTGEDVVIKEARPFVELSRDGRDATDRLAQEEKILNVLSKTGVTPKVYAKFWDWENLYIAEEYLDAINMREVMLQNTPLLLVNPTKEKSAEFYRIYKSIFISLLKAVESIHTAGVVIGDLSPTNILVDQATMTAKIIDLEGAFQPEVDSAEEIYTPGFRVEAKGRKKESNFSDDIYALGAIMMYSMFPIVAMAYLRTDVFSKVLPALVTDLGWSNTPVKEIIQQLTNNSISCRQAIEALEADCTITDPMPGPDRSLAPSINDICQGIGRFITTNYRLNAPYTLFPIDPHGRNTNPLSLGLGATGVIYALQMAGIQVPTEAMQRYLLELEAIPSGLPPGLLVGDAGAAWALVSIGQIETARRLLDRANSSPLARSHHSLYYGMAGVGMANLAMFLSCGDKSYLEAAVNLAEALEASSISSERGLHWQDEGGIRIGFGYGQSGVALFLLRLSQVLNDAKWRGIGQQALEYDLSFAVEVESGVVSFGGETDQIQTLEQYIEQGTGGIAKVAIRYGLWDRADRLLVDLHRKYSGFPGLIYGLTGFVDVFTDAYIFSKNRKYLEMAERPLQGLLDIYLFESGEGYAAPGDNLFRISFDYATGLAGILHTLNRLDKLLPDEFCLDILDKLQ